MGKALLSGLPRDRQLELLLSVDPEIWKAARLDGIPAWRVYSSIILPMLGHSFATAAILLLAAVVNAHLSRGGMVLGATHIGLGWTNMRAFDLERVTIRVVRGEDDGVGAGAKIRRHLNDGGPHAVAGLEIAVRAVVIEVEREALLLHLGGEGVDNAVGVRDIRRGDTVGDTAHQLHLRFRQRQGTCRHRRLPHLGFGLGVRRDGAERGQPEQAAA